MGTEVEQKKVNPQENCIFCKIARKESKAEIIYENDKYVAFLDINPTNPGETLVIPKKHSVNMLDTPDAALGEMMGVCKLVAVNLIKQLKAEGFNIWINNFPAAGQMIFHLHAHVVPRFPDDGVRIVRLDEKTGKAESAKKSEK